MIGDTMEAISKITKLSEQVKGTAMEILELAAFLKGLDIPSSVTPHQYSFKDPENKEFQILKNKDGSITIRNSWQYEDLKFGTETVSELLMQISPEGSINTFKPGDWVFLIANEYKRLNEEAEKRLQSYSELARKV